MVMSFGYEQYILIYGLFDFNENSFFAGENYSRPQSEIKASTPVEKPPPPPQSAPPQLTEQAKMDGKPLSTLQ